MKVSLNFRKAAFARETGRVMITLMTLTHPDLPEPIRISTDPTQRIEGLTNDIDVVYGTVSRGETYLFFPVRLKLPDEADEGPGAMTIEFDNVHRAYTEAIRSIFTPVTVGVEIVMDDDLDTVEAAWPEFEMTDIQYDALRVTGTMKVEKLESEPFPSGSFSPAYFPGVF